VYPAANSGVWRLGTRKPIAAPGVGEPVRESLALCARGGAQHSRAEQLVQKWRLLISHVVEEEHC
jgi:hypothetical protein